MPIDVIDVTITTETTPISREGFGLPLILSGEKELEYTVYTDAADVATEFGSDSETAAIANRLKGQSPAPNRIAVIGVDYTAGTDTPSKLTDALNTEKDKGNFDWYFLLATEQGDDEVKALADYANSNNKFFAGSKDNNTILDEADMNNDRTLVLMHTEPTQYPAEGLIGIVAPQDPGSLTWAYQQVQGVTVSGFDDTETLDILDKNGNVIVKKSGMEFTYEGKTVGGEYADITRSKDFIKARIEEEVLFTTVNANKIPFTQAGVNQIVSAIESALRMAVNNGIIGIDADGNPEYEITAPGVDDIAESDRANRVLPNVEAVIRLAGAIHETKLNVVLTV